MRINNDNSPDKIPEEDEFTPHEADKIKFKLETRYLTSHYDIENGLKATELVAKIHAIVNEINDPNASIYVHDDSLYIQGKRLRTIEEQELEKEAIKLAKESRRERDLKQYKILSKRLGFE